MAISKPGFTMIEILVVVILIGGLAAMVLPNVMKRMGKGQIGTTKIALNGMKSALNEYKMDMGHYPTKQEGGLEALMNRPSSKGSDRWKGEYLDGAEVPLDAWNNEFFYSAPPQQFSKEYKFFELYSKGDLSDEKNENDPDLRVGS
ncbi:type II secretion system major pseudopilin GspG [Candidatus Babeliales bacterium]|nr:type II secretion system major pseudopilin GspG [Candidatus Babeliales bacterium]